MCFAHGKYYSRDVCNSIYSLNSLSKQILCVLPPPSPLSSTTLLTRCCTYFIWEMLLKRYGRNIIFYNVLKSLVYSKRPFVAVSCYVQFVQICTCFLSMSIFVQEIATVDRSLHNYLIGSFKLLFIAQTSNHYVIKRHMIPWFMLLLLFACTCRPASRRLSFPQRNCNKITCRFIT